MIIILAPYIFTGLGFVLIYTIILVFMLIRKSLQLTSNFMEELYDIEYARIWKTIRNTPPRKLIWGLVEFFSLWARGMFWLAVRGFLLIGFVVSIGAVCHILGYGDGEWPMAITGVIGLIWLCFHAASALGKFVDEELS
mgnify:CR=1 FL=1